MKIRFKALAALAAAVLLCLCAAAFAESADATYVENEWDYADGSMDISRGIPDDACGQLQQIREAGVLKVATEPYYAPQEFIDPDLSGQDGYVGADMRLARLVAERMGVALEIVPLDFSMVLAFVAEGECDLAISALSYTPERASRVSLSKGYYYAEGGVVCGLLIRSEDRDVITGVESLEGKNIVAQSGSLQETVAAEHVTQYREFRRVNVIQEAFEALQSGEVDAAAVNPETARKYIENNPGCGLELVPDVGFLLEPQFDGDRVAAKKGELQLIYFVNGVIDEVLASGQYEEWMREAEARAAELGL